MPIILRDVLSLFIQSKSAQPSHHTHFSSLPLAPYSLVRTQCQQSEKNLNLSAT